MQTDQTLFRKKKVVSVLAGKKKEAVYTVNIKTEAVCTVNIKTETGRPLTNRRKINSLVNRICRITKYIPKTTFTYILNVAVNVVIHVYIYVFV